MYARRFDDGPRFRPTSLGIALAINGGVIAALLLAAPELIPASVDTPLTTRNIPLDEPSPLPTPAPTTDRPTARSPQRPDLTAPTDLPAEQQVWVDPTPADPAPLPGPAATGTPQVEVPPPAFVAAAVDPRYAGDFQPDYPDTARDAGQEGLVTIRVLIGTDGRVKQVQRVGGPDVFWRAASRHALARWRFSPATRGGVPEESWRVMTVRFRLD